MNFYIKVEQLRSCSYYNLVIYYHIMIENTNYLYEEQNMIDYNNGGQYGKDKQY